MTDDQKKLLTEKLLGECWHEPHLGYNYEPHGLIAEDDEGCPNQCKKCHYGNNWCPFKNRTFTTAQDFMDVFNALVGKGWWVEVKNFMYDRFDTDSGDYFEIWYHGKNEDGTYRLCSIVVEWMEVK